MKLDTNQKKFLAWLIESGTIQHDVMDIKNCEMIYGKLFKKIVDIISTNTYKESDKPILNELRDKYKEQYSNRNK